MGKKSKTKKELPFVSVCTPTFNRRPFIPYMIKCFKHQDYPMDKMEWIIIDDGTDKIEDIIKEANLPQIKYIKLEQKIPLGKKRNMLHQHAKGEFIVYMDDDDYYPPTRVSHAIDMLLKNPKALCAGASEIYIYFKHINQMIQFGPYGPNHATAGTFAFRKELLKEHKYEDHAALAEEKAFLKNYTVPFVQLEPKKVILVFSHIHNTFDKKKLLDNPHPNFVKTSDKTVDEFIKEPELKDFYVNKIEGLLNEYKPGDPEMKPDVIKQMKEIEEKRKSMIPQNNDSPIMLQQPGKEPIQLSIEQVLQHLNEQNKKMNELVSILKQRDETIITLQNQINSIQSENKDELNSTFELKDIKKYIDSKTNLLENKVDKLITIIENKPNVRLDIKETKSVLPESCNFNLELKKN
jgi:glycosyltransferase involved in cell wall biosynthesis